VHLRFHRAICTFIGSAYFWTIISSRGILCFHLCTCYCWLFYVFFVEWWFWVLLLLFILLFIITDLVFFLQLFKHRGGKVWVHWSEYKCGRLEFIWLCTQQFYNFIVAGFVSLPFQSLTLPLSLVPVFWWVNFLWLGLQWYYCLLFEEHVWVLHWAPLVVFDGLDCWWFLELLVPTPTQKIFKK